MRTNNGTEQTLLFRFVCIFSYNIYHIIHYLAKIRILQPVTNNGFPRDFHDGNVENFVPTVLASGHGPLLEGNVLGQHDPLKKRVLQTVALVNVFLGGQKKYMLGKTTCSNIGS